MQVNLGLTDETCDAGQSDTLGDDGQPNPIISWSDLHVLYQLPDGTKWAEHGNFFDSEDVVSMPV